MSMADKCGATFIDWIWISTALGLAMEVEHSLFVNFVGLCRKQAQLQLQSHTHDMLQNWEQDTQNLRDHSTPYPSPPFLQHDKGIQLFGHRSRFCLQCRVHLLATPPQHIFNPTLHEL